MSRWISACCSSPSASRILVAALRCEVCRSRTALCMPCSRFLRSWISPSFSPASWLACSRVSALALRSEGLAHLAFECLLAARQIVGLPRQVFHLVGGFLAAHAGEHLLGFLQTLGGAARLRLALRRPGLLATMPRRACRPWPGSGGPASAASVPDCAPRMLSLLLLARCCALLLAPLLLSLLCLAVWPCWPCCALLPLLSLLTLLSLLPLLALLTLLALLPCWPVAAQLLALLSAASTVPVAAATAPPRGAASPAASAAGTSAAGLSSAARPVPAAACASCSSFCSASSICCCCCCCWLEDCDLLLSYWFFSVSSSRSKSPSISRAPAAAAAATAARAGCRTPPGYRANVASARIRYCSAFCSGAQRVLPLARPSTCPRPDPWLPRPCSMSFTKLLKESPASVNWRAFMRSASDFAWSRSFDCTPARNAAFSASRALGARALQLIPGGRDDFLLALRDLVLILVVAAATAAIAAGLLRLRVVALERLRFDEVDIGARRGARVLGHGVQAHHVARLDLEILQRDGAGTGRSLGAAPAWRTVFSGAPFTE